MVAYLTSDPDIQKVPCVLVTVVVFLVVFGGGVRCCCERKVHNVQ